VDPNAHTRASLEATDPRRDDDEVDPKAHTALHDGEALDFDEGLTDDTARLGDVAEVTALRERPPPPVRRGGAINVRKGDTPGKTILLETTPTVIGRASWAELCVEDPTVSREHLELRFMSADGSWLVQDLESSSGTLLNGVELSMPTQIKHGDLLAFGQSEVRFRWAEHEPSPRAEPPPKERTKTKQAPSDDRGKTKKTRLTQVKKDKPKRSGEGKGRALIAAAVVAALLIVGGAIAGVRYLVILPGETDEAALKVQVESLVEEAQRLIEEGDLPGAKQRLDAALALLPDHPLANSLLRTIDSDLDALAVLTEAEKLFEAGKIEEALKMLLRIPDSSRYAKRRERLRARAGELARKASVRRIEVLIEDGLLEEAEAALQEHLERWPDDAFARGMTARIQALRDAPPPENPAVARARDAFAAGEQIKARIVIEPEAARGSRPAERYLADLDRFEASFARGKAKLKNKNKGARADLEEAWSLVPRLGRGTRGGVANSLKRPLADALFLDAIAKRGAGRECEWAKAILRADSLRPGDRKIKAQRRQVDQKASAALSRARARKADNPKQAAQIAREGLCFAKGGSKTGRALKKLTR
jgi:pSer/pThr/pTyr-binding forkhead associated (FHA) protein/thioredoxin-like negative regulator of GroEL